jgi:hypothetical protein
MGYAGVVSCIPRARRFFDASAGYVCIGCHIPRFFDTHTGYAGVDSSIPQTLLSSTRIRVMLV